MTQHHHKIKFGTRCLQAPWPYKTITRRFSFMGRSASVVATSNSELSINDTPSASTGPIPSIGTPIGSTPSGSPTQGPSPAQSLSRFSSSGEQEKFEHPSIECPRLPVFEFESTQSETGICTPTNFDYIGPLSCLSDVSWLEDIPFLNLDSNPSTNVSLVGTAQESTEDYKPENSIESNHIKLSEPLGPPYSVTGVKLSHEDAESSETSHPEGRGPGSFMYATLGFHAELCERLESLLDHDENPPESQSRFIELF